MSRSGWVLQVGTDASLESEGRFLSTEVGANRRWHKARRDNRVCEGGALAGKPFRSTAEAYWKRIDRERLARLIDRHEAAMAPLREAGLA